MLLVLLCLFLAPPRVGEMSKDVRMGTGVWLAGEGFTGAKVRYDNTVTVNDKNLESEVRAALAGPTVDWTKTGQDAPTFVYNDQVCIAYPNVEQIGAYCVPFCVRNRDGISKTYLVNAPVAFGISGANPKSLSTSASYPIVGRHLSATRAKPSIWIVDGKGNISRCARNVPGGSGTGNTVDIDRSVLWFTIPANVQPGDYQLFIFTGENRWGISNLIPVTIVAPTPQNVVSVQVSSGTDVTNILEKAQPGSLYQLSPGILNLKRTVDVPGNTTFVGAGPSSILRADSSLLTDKSKLVGPRDSMLRLTGSNITFRDLTIELTPGTTRSAIAAGPGVDSVTFENCRFVSNTPAANEWGYCDGFFYRFGLWRYWKFVNCDFECQFPFEATNGPLNGFGSNGSFDFGLVSCSRFRPPHGRLSASLLGSCFGRGTLLWSSEVSGSRRGLALSSGDGSINSVVACCNFSDMLSELWNGETILHEARGSAVFFVKAGDNFTFTPFGNDTQDRQRWTACIISGKGFGQYRIIASSSNGTHTLETPWEIPPDQTSCVLISQCPTDCAFVFNRFSNCVGGINLYGNSFGNVINSNWMRGSHEGIMLNTNWNSAAVSGVGGQNGDGRSTSMWHSARSNIFEDGAGFSFIAPRSTIDCGVYKQPQVAFLSTAFTTTFGTVTSQLWAAEGLEQKANTTSLKFPLIDYITSHYDTGYSGKSRYLHDVIDRRPQQPLWYRTASGIGNVRVSGTKWDDVPVPADKTIQVAP